MLCCCVECWAITPPDTHVCAHTQTHTHTHTHTRCCYCPLAGTDFFFKSFYPKTPSTESNWFIYVFSFSCLFFVDQNLLLSAHVKITQQVFAFFNCEKNCLIKANWCKSSHSLTADTERSRKNNLKKKEQHKWQNMRRGFEQRKDGGKQQTS